MSIDPAGALIVLAGALVAAVPVVAWLRDRTTPEPDQTPEERLNDQADTAW